MSEKRETILRLLQDETGRILDVKIFQEMTPEKPETPEEPETPEKPLTVIELKPDTEETALYNLTEGSVVDWGDGSKSVVTAEEANLRQTVLHAYATTATANRVVTIDGVIDRRGEQAATAFDSNALIAVRTLGEVRGEASLLFAGCGNLTAIPAGLFDHCTAMTSFNYCFYGCSNLTAIPAGLFDHCTAVTDLSGCFKKCNNLTGETPYTMVDGKKVKLWERSPENGFAKVTSHESCFKDCPYLSDYAEIPSDWK